MKKHPGTTMAMALLFTGILAAQPIGPDRVSRTISDCRARTGEFRASLRHAMEHSSLKWTEREHQLDKDANRMERAVNKLHETWNLEHKMHRSREHASAAIAAAQDINRAMLSHRFNPDVHRQWDVVRGELNHVAEVFALPRIRW
jgi:hypothetical protein